MKGRPRIQIFHQRRGHKVIWFLLLALAGEQKAFFFFLPKHQTQMRGIKPYFFLRDAIKVRQEKTKEQEKINDDSFSIKKLPRPCWEI